METHLSCIKVRLARCQFTTNLQILYFSFAAQKDTVGLANMDMSECEMQKNCHVLFFLNVARWSITLLSMLNFSLDLGKDKLIKCGRGLIILFINLFGFDNSLAPFGSTTICFSQKVAYAHWNLGSFPCVSLSSGTRFWSCKALTLHLTPKAFIITTSIP